MSHKEFMRSLSTNEKRSLTKKTDHNALLRLVALCSLLALSSSIIFIRIRYWPLLLPLQGLLLISLFHLLHECIHETPFRTRRFNSIVGAICGFVLLLPSEWFRYFHRDHHRFTQVEGKDPELESPKPATTTQWLVHISGVPVFISLLKVIATCASGSISSPYIPDGAKVKVIRQARIMCAAYLIILLIFWLLESTALIWIWVIPLIIGQPFLRLYLLAEHTLCESTDDMLQNTRTVFTNPVVRWFTWNMPYHTEHHVFPAVPFHQLPALHKKMAAYLQVHSKSYGEFNRELYKTLR